VSSADHLLTNDDLLRLFYETEKNNNQNSISGILLHNTGNFLQYFEGGEEQIKELYYSHIVLDHRHHDAIILFESKIKNQYFEGYQAGFSSILQKNSIQKLRAYLNLLKYVDSKEMDVLSKTVNSFLT
jgi:hypothetical protein